eukprot:CAMPEP_0171346116 /NCGR_PEP_ID=MMETSP0878-20121228/23547_1 /TAXON_ID=67004 /ORGANISM="Thalassiosira weissflogii, Strain CCMP1336" /LENGTH=1044 /DNA_ID=CAMNT_0011849709 /DNA_START=21 /DNA_END=3155 /DNA_ORIENTATION=-
MAVANLENADPNTAASAAPGLGKPPRIGASKSKKASRRRCSSIGVAKNGRHFNNSDSEDYRDDDESGNDGPSVLTPKPVHSKKLDKNDDQQDGWSLNGDDSSSSSEDDSDVEEEANRKKVKKRAKVQPQKQQRRGRTSIAVELTPPKAKLASSSSKQRRRRRSSARFVRLSGKFSPTRDGGSNNNNSGANASNGAGSASPGSSPENYTSSEHLGEIYKQAIRMNAENKINAGNSWGLRLIENMDKFIEEEEEGGVGGNGGTKFKSPRNGSGGEGAEASSSSRKKKVVEERGRVNFTKASCTLDASVKIYSYRVDDVHLSSYRVLANLNRSDNKKGSQYGDEDDGVGGVDVDEEEDGDGNGKKAARKKNAERRGHIETIESNLANINMSKLDSAYDIDPLFHKMSKSFDEGGAKGLLLGNLGVSSNGCRIVFDSKEEFDDEDSRNKAGTLDIISEEAGDDVVEVDNVQDKPDENGYVWKEGDVDITALSSKLNNLLISYGVKSSDNIPFVPQLESLRDDYAALEEQGFAVDEKDIAKEGRKRSKLYDAPEEEEKEAERSIHIIAMERSRGSVLGTSFTTNLNLSLDSGHGEGEFAPDFGIGGGLDGANDDGDDDFGGDVGGSDDFLPDDDNHGGFSSPSFKRLGDKRSYDNTKVLLDALCDGDNFLDDEARSDYAFFDVSKLEKATRGNMWAGSQHWKKMAEMKKDSKSSVAKKTSFEDDRSKEKEKKKLTKKDRVFVDLTDAPNVQAIFQKKKTSKRTKKTVVDPFQLPKKKQLVDYLLPPDANVDITHLTRLFSRPNAAVRRGSSNKDKSLGKSVGFYDIEEKALGFNDDNSFGGDNDAGGFGFDFAYDDEGNDSRGDDVDYRLDDFDEVRKVEKIDINYATVAKKVDVRRLKKDLWTELEAQTTVVPSEEFTSKPENPEFEEAQDDVLATPSESGMVSFKETVEKIDRAQSQNGVTVSFYFICCLHLANEKGLKLDSAGLEDFMISLDNGSAPIFGTFGQEVQETSEKLASVAISRSKREQNRNANYVDEGEDSDGETMERE